MRRFRSMIRLIPALLIGFYLFCENTGVAQQKFLEFADEKYNYAFQYPAGWKKNDPQGREIGEVRIFVGNPIRNSAMVVVGKLEKRISRDQMNKNTDPKVFINPIMENTIEQIYRKRSKDLKATKMVINHKKIFLSEVGIRLSISAAHFFSKGPPMFLNGTHIIPFDKGYMISFLMSTYAGRKTETEKKILRRVFDSFHLQ